MRRLVIHQPEIIRQNSRPDKSRRVSVAPDMMEFTIQSIIRFFQPDDFKIEHPGLIERLRLLSPASISGINLFFVKSAQIIILCFKIRIRLRILHGDAVSILDSGSDRRVLPDKDPDCLSHDGHIHFFPNLKHEVQIINVRPRRGNLPCKNVLLCISQRQIFHPSPRFLPKYSNNSLADPETEAGKMLPCSIWQSESCRLS